MAEIVTMPKLGFDMAEGTLVRWVITEGEPVQKGAVLAEIETDKATVEVESAYDGLVLRHLVAQGAIVPVNSPIAVIGAVGEFVDLGVLTGASQVADGSPVKELIPESAKQIDEPATEVILDTQMPDGLRASPLARRMAEELGIELRKIRGSGPGGRIIRKDIEAFRTHPEEVRTPAPEVPALHPASVVVSVNTERETRTIPLTRLRAAIARRMAEATQQIPHFYITHDYDVEALLALRQQINNLLPEEEKISVNDFIIKATALTLLKFPNLNASIDLKNDQLIQHATVNIGAAVAVPNGLLTVVCRNADQKSLRWISIEIKELINRAREGKVRPDDIEGSTFTVSNLGMFEVDQFTAIINPPEAAILAVGSARQVPVIVDGNIRSGTRMKATLSVDHRISDGAEGARFMQALDEYIEAPLRLLL